MLKTRMTKKLIHSALLLALITLPAVATPPVLDGLRDASYPGAWSWQTVETGFGDNFSELNAAYAQIEGDVLYLLITGNLENNFNKFNIFLDTIPGGQNVLLNDANNGGNNPENDGWAGKHAGMTFDGGFAADYMLILRNGDFGGPRFDIDYAIIGGGLGAFETASDVFGGSFTGANPSALPNGIGVAFDNSNTAGVAGGSGPANIGDALAVTTGIELAIPLSALGNPNAADIKVSAMINGSNHDYLSNQFLGGLDPPQGNLGGDGNGTFTGHLGDIDLNNFAGNQYFHVVPEPSSLALLLLGWFSLWLRPSRA